MNFVFCRYHMKLPKCHLLSVFGFHCSVFRTRERSVYSLGLSVKDVQFTTRLRLLFGKDIYICEEETVLMNLLVIIGLNLS